MLEEGAPLYSQETISNRYQAVQQSLETSYQKSDLDDILTCELL